jgi:hypothetical protein
MNTFTMNTSTAEAEAFVRQARDDVTYMSLDRKQMRRHAVQSGLMAVAGVVLGIGTFWYIIRAPDFTGQQATMAVFLLCVAVVFVAVGLYTATLPVIAYVVHNKLQRIEAETLILEQVATIDRLRGIAITMVTIFEQASSSDPLTCFNMLKTECSHVQTMKKTLADI